MALESLHIAGVGIARGYVGPESLTRLELGPRVLEYRESAVWLECFQHGAPYDVRSPFRCAGSYELDEAGNRDACRYAQRGWAPAGIEGAA